MRAAILPQSALPSALLRLSREDAEVLVPSGASLASARKAVHALGVAAHPDDLELMALGPIARGLRHPRLGFAGVVVTTGAGGVRAGAYRRFTDARMAETRRAEQRRAAVLGRYALLAQLGHASKTVLDPAKTAPVDDLESLLRALRPSEVYTHDLADRHDTHVAVLLRLVAAIRRLPLALRPARLVGCEVWRGLDWLKREDQVALETPGAEGLGVSLLGVFKSQLSDRPYDAAAAGRRRANAVFSGHHAPARARGASVTLGMDLTPLIQGKGLEPRALFGRYLERFRGEVSGRISRLAGPPRRGGKP